MVVIPLFYIVLVIAGGILASRKGRSVLGWLFLTALCPLLLIILICLSSLETPKARTMRQLDAADYRDCPFCAESIRREASVCKHCGKDVEPKQGIPKMQCPRCGYKTPATGTPCVHCGADLR